MVQQFFSRLIFLLCFSRMKLTVAIVFLVAVLHITASLSIGSKGMIIFNDIILQSDFNEHRVRHIPGSDRTKSVLYFIQNSREKEVGMLLRKLDSLPSRGGQIRSRKFGSVRLYPCYLHICGSWIQQHDNFTGSLQRFL